MFLLFLYVTYCHLTIFAFIVNLSRLQERCMASDIIANLFKSGLNYFRSSRLGTISSRCAQKNRSVCNTFRNSQRKTGGLTGRNGPLSVFCVICVERLESLTVSIIVTRSCLMKPTSDRLVNIK